MFKLKNVRYKNILQIDELTIVPGIITAIVGESGSGKTTMLKLLNHMINYSEGTVTYRGRELKSLDAVLLRRKVTMAPQIPVIFPGTVRDNLLIGLNFAGKDPISDDRMKAEIARIGLNKKLADQAELLSGGEKQRLALARVVLIQNVSWRFKSFLLPGKVGIGGMISPRKRPHPQFIHFILPFTRSWWIKTTLSINHLATLNARHSVNALQIKPQIMPNSDFRAKTG